MEVSFNQMANTQNRAQGNAVKALCVCSAGLLRSPSIAKYLAEKGYNTRACGTSQEYALIPLSPALVYWADEIHVVSEQEMVVQDMVSRTYEKMGEWIGGDKKKPVVYTYRIPDMYGTFDSSLMQIIDEEWRGMNE